jgi:nucleotide-binding universal stress UspA family protein
MNSEAPSYIVSFYFRKILVPIDGSESSYRALQVAVDLAQRYGSKIVVVHVKPKGTSLIGERDPITKAKERLKGTSISIVYKYLEYDPLSDSPSSTLVREITSEGYDLVVIGARGKSLLPDLHIGSTTLSLIVNTATSIFIIR